MYGIPSSSPKPRWNWPTQPRAQYADTGEREGRALADWFEAWVARCAAEKDVFDE